MKVIISPISSPIKPFTINCLHLANDSSCKHCTSDCFFVLSGTCAKYGRRLMDTAAASLWNPLPIDIKNALNIVSFKKMLKTHLF